MDFLAGKAKKFYKQSPRPEERRQSRYLPHGQHIRSSRRPSTSQGRPDSSLEGPQTRDPGEIRHGIDKKNPSIDGTNRSDDVESIPELDGSSCINHSTLSRDESNGDGNTLRTAMYAGSESGDIPQGHDGNRAAGSPRVKRKSLAVAGYHVANSGCPNHGNQNILPYTTPESGHDLPIPVETESGPSTSAWVELEGVKISLLDHVGSTNMKETYMKEEMRKADGVLRVLHQVLHYHTTTISKIKAAVLDSALNTPMLSNDIETAWRGSDGPTEAVRLLVESYNVISEDISARVRESVRKSNANTKSFEVVLNQRNAYEIVNHFAVLYDGTFNELRSIEIKVGEIASRVLGRSQRPSLSLQDKLHTQLDQVLAVCERGNVSNEQLNRMSSRIRQALSRLPPKEVEYAEGKGIHDLLNLLIGDYQNKSSTENQFRAVATEINSVLDKVPGIRRKSDDYFQPNDVAAALSRLLSYYQPFVQAKGCLERIGRYLQAASRDIVKSSQLRGWQNSDELDIAVKIVLDQLRSDARSLGNQVSEQDKQLNDQADRIKRTDKDFQTLQKKFDKLETELNALRRSRTADLANARAEEINKLEATKAAHDEYVAERERIHQNKIKRQESTYRFEIGRLEALVKDESEKHIVAVQVLEAKLEQQRIDFDRDIDEMKQNHARQVNEQKEAAIEQQEDLRKEVGEYRSALVSRQHTAGLADSEIGSRFSGLISLVDAISRLQWDKKKESRWPVSESELKRSGGNVRKLRQQIVQTAIWFVLNQSIFQSPFEVFGNTGQEIHREWARGYAKDRTAGFGHWPEATDASEQIRSEEVNRCMDDVKKCDTEAKRAMKRAYDQRLTEISNAIVKAVGSVSELSAAEERDCQHLVKIAADFWLDVSSHKCRITLHFPSPMVNVLDRAALSGKVSLVVQPEVRRKGTARGDRLDREQIVKSCEGQYAVFQPR